MRAYRKLALHRRVVVNLTTGSAIEGVLWSEQGDLVVLKDASLMEPGRGSVPMDGEVIVQRDRINFVQVA